MGLPAVVAVAILAPLRSAVADWNDVPTGSMIPTILVGDRIFINKLAYDLKVPFTTGRWPNGVIRSDATRRDIALTSGWIRLVMRITRCHHATDHPIWPSARW